MDQQGVRSLFDLTDRVAIVTGGTRGIGLAIASGFVGAGAKVVVASRKAEACAAVEKRLITEGGEALGVATHLGELDSLHDLVQATMERFGRIDIVINNAANALAQPVGEFTEGAWQKSFDVNLRGPVFLMQETMPYLRESPSASVVNVISAGAFLFSGGVAMYAAAKAALMSFTRAFASELASDGIRVNALAPGAVNTDMTRSTGEQGMAGMEKASLQKRIADPDEMVGPAIFLASDASSFITGQVIKADGGMVAGS
jgi:NAD(P)-dependent dehydrogenase (short-subunit alcohol dehydrogenase family)